MRWAQIPVLWLPEGVTELVLKSLVQSKDKNSIFYLIHGTSNIFSKSLRRSIKFPSAEMWKISPLITHKEDTGLVRIRFRCEQPKPQNNGDLSKIEL